MYADTKAQVGHLYGSIEWPHWQGIQQYTMGVGLLHRRPKWCGVAVGYQL